MFMNMIRKPVAALGVLFSLTMATQAHAVIIVRGKDGGCRLCIGSRDACAELCWGSAVAAGYDRAMLAVGDVRIVGDTLTVSDVEGPFGMVEMRDKGQVVFHERIELAEAVVTDLDNGNSVKLSDLAGSSCQ